MVFKHGGTSPYLHISFPFHYLKNKYIYLHSVLLALKMTSESISSMVKVKLSLCLPKHHAMKTCWRVEVKVKLSLCLNKHYALKTYWGMKV